MPERKDDPDDLVKPAGEVQGDGPQRGYFGHKGHDDRHTPRSGVPPTKVWRKTEDDDRDDPTDSRTRPVDAPDREGGEGDA